MTSRPRILVVDDEEAILETMAFTFEDDYEVLTSASPRDALALLEREGPVAVVISDQRMPEMTGVEFLARVFAVHPTTVRIILTGFADMDAIIRAINDGHVYAYITKPWEPELLKQVVRRAVDHHALAVENERLVGDLRASNLFLEAVMDELDTGALAVDADGVVRAANRLAREYLGLPADARGRPLDEVLAPEVRERVGGVAMTLESEAGCYQEMDLPVGKGVRLRVHARTLARPDGGTLGRVILAREISHEPLRRRFDEILDGLVAGGDGALRERLASAQGEITSLVREAGAPGVASPGRTELRDRATRTLTAIEYWLAVDDALAREAFPDAQPLLDRMRLANQRWPQERLPERVRELARRVESYYESGENPKQPVL
jgi:PAS domain S-box-containing protein